jgi:hypothetical protein
MMNHIGNLAPIPADLNGRKTSRFLSDISSVVDRANLVRYEDIPDADFANYSSTSKVQDLVAFRGGMIEKDVIEYRHTAITA